MTQNQIYSAPSGVVAGPYRWTLRNPITGQTSYVGIQEEAPRIEMEPELEPVRGQNLGNTIQDMLNAGANCTVSGIFTEFALNYGDGAWKKIWPFSTVSALNNSTAANIGHAGLDLVGAFARATKSGGQPIGTFEMFATALHDVSTSGWNTTTPYQFHFKHLTSAPNNPLSFLLGTRTRNLPFRFQCLPYDSGGVTVFYTTTLTN